MGAPTSADVFAGEPLKLPVPYRGARRVGRYLLCDQIGSGGMATIHLARLLGPQGFSRTVAIKQLHPQFAQNPQFVSMLLDEARLAVRVRHGNVISPLDIVATESELFIVMDYVNGESFANLLAASEGPLRPALAAAVLVQVLLGLHAAHEATREQGDALGLVHRDVSPQNILVGQDGVARMLDFGIAKAVARTQTTDGGMLKGKLGYMAPEQIRLMPVDRRADVFSAGVVLWEALTGSGLFVADAFGASIELILHGEITPPSRLNPAVTPELDAVVLKALARDREARFQDAVSFAAALERATPLASALDVIDWVETLAGPELARRAELVRRAEAVNPEPVRAERSNSAAIDPSAINSQAIAPASINAEGVRATSVPHVSREGRPTTLRAGWAEAVGAPSSLWRRNPTLLGIATPGEARLGGDLASRESTGVALGADRVAPAGAEPRSRRGWKPVGIALGILLAGATAAAGVFSLSPGPRAAEISVAREVSADDPALAPVPAVAPPPSAAPSAAEPVPEPLEPEPPPPPGVDPVRTLPGSAAPMPELERANPPSRASGSSKARRAAAARKSAVTRAAKAEAKPKLRASSDTCSPPWVMNAQQVKVFKAECLR